MFSAKMRYGNVIVSNTVIKRMLKYVSLIVIFGCIGLSCNTINPVEPTPTYIHIDSFAFKDNPHVIPPKLSLSHQINSVFAYYNNNPIGIFDLPVTIPVIATGAGKLSLFPSIPIDGLNNFLSAYPFYAPDTFSFVAQPGTVIHRIPVTEYFDSTKHFLDYSFETASGIYFNLLNGSVPISTTTNSAEVFEGTGSGKIYLSLPSDTLSECISASNFNVPTGVDAYIELNYKNTVPFYVGLKSGLNGTTTYTQQYLSGIYPSDHWQKFYLAIKDFVGQYPGDYYTLYIKTYLPSGTSNGTVLLDNVQLVYF